MIGRTLAHYTITEKIGEGGMGEIYCARDIKLNRDVALKMLPADMAADPERVNRFQREARALAALDHPNIVTVHSVEEADGVHFLTMGLVEGRTLDQHLSDTGLPLDTFFDIALPLVDAVAAAHESGVIHRDLKPGNIMLTPDGRLKVLDFGLAKLAEPMVPPGEDPADERTQPALTQAGMVMGTVPYMSPEQLEDKPLDHRSDLFSLGTLFYEMVAGRLPFQGDSSAGVISAILKEQPPAVIDHRPDTPPGLSQLIARCLEKNPASRYQTARDIHKELKAMRAKGNSAESKAGLGIAVLPFADMSPAKDQDYFCEGMAEEIMNALVQVKGIRVVSRTSAFRAKQDNNDLSEIGRILSVGHILEGSVRVAGNRMRVTAQLVDVESGYHLWSERYDRVVEDVFAVQDEIAAGAVEAVKVRLTPDERPVRARSRVKNLDAYRHYLKGRHYRYSRNDHANAARCYQDAIAIDPGHAPSWVGLAETAVLTAMYQFRPAGSAYAEAKRALATAEKIQGESADALFVQGIVAFCERDLRFCEDVLQRAVDLQSDHVLAKCWLALLFSSQNRADEAVTVLEHAREIDPLAAYPHAMTGFSLLVMGRANESEQPFRQALDFGKENLLALWGNGVAMVHLERHEEGIALLEEAVALFHGGAHLLGVLGWALARAGRDDDARAILEEVRSRPAPAPTAVSEAWLLSELGEMDAAWEVLERARDETQGFATLTGLPGFALFREDPRFAGYVESLGLSSEVMPP